MHGRVNVNTASAEQLQRLPGVGQKKAERVIAYRKRHRFRTVVELARVKGIGLKTVKRLRSYLRTSGPTTLGEPQPPAADGQQQAPPETPPSNDASEDINNSTCACVCPAP